MLNIFFGKCSASNAVLCFCLAKNKAIALLYKNGFGAKMHFCTAVVNILLLCFAEHLTLLCFFTL